MESGLSADQSAREHELAILYEIASISKYVDSRERVFELTLDKACRLLGSEIAIFYVFDDEQGLLRARAARGVRMKHVAASMAPSEGGFDHMVSGACDDLPNPLLQQYPLRAALSIPLRQMGKLLGWLFVARLRRGSFDDYEQGLYMVFAEQVASALHMTLAWEQQRAQQAALQLANDQLEHLVAEATATAQKQDQLLQTVRALSTPVLNIDAHILLLPLIGLIDAARAALIQQRLLEEIAEHHARVAIIDISGVAVMDAQVVSLLMQTAKAVQLLGATVLMCGIAPEVAQSMVGLSDGFQITTTHDLHSAIRMSFRIAGR
ncbi:GAF domain-containing protein [Chloroflexia bacterium SDU3-3]|nr:GAF domain-containing protein [Chloroflexia bacterium SDU3-3]